jgi:hypothetical protein
MTSVAAAPTLRSQTTIVRDEPLETLPQVREIAFIDPAVADVDVLLAGLRPDVEPILLDAAEPAPRQMARALAGRRSLDAIHVIAHGAPGEVSFAAGKLTLACLDEPAADLAKVGHALEQGGTLLLWSCHAGAGARGTELLQGLARATRVRVGASTRLVGAASHGGSWELDVRPGGAAQAPLSAEGAAAYAGILASGTWKGTTSTDWSTASNWNNSHVPALNDTITIQTVTRTNFAPTLSTSSATLKSLTISGTTSLTIASGATLTVTNGTSLTSSGGITGNGVVSSTIAATATSTATITASGGTLEIQQAITNSGALKLAVSSGASDTLLLDAASAATSLTFSGSTGTLELNTSGALTLTSPLAIGANTVKLDAAGTAQLTAAGVTLAGGTISGTGSLAGATALTGYGTVSAPLMTGTGTITASGGTLDLTGLVGSRPLAIDATKVSDLKIDGTATSSAAISITNANQTLEIGASGALTITGAQSVTNGTIKLDGGTLTDSSGVTLGSGSKLTGFGTFNPAFTGTNSGTVTASGGTLALTANISASSGLNFNIADSASSILKLNGTVGGTNTFAFVGTHGALELNDVTISAGGLHFSGSVSGLSVAGSANPDLSTTNYVNVQATITTAVLTDSTHIALFNGSTDLGTITLASATTATHVDWFADSGQAGSVVGSGTDIVLSDVVCFAAGTRILTPTGERAVETLAAGEPVLTLSGEALCAQPIRWVGHRRIDLTTHPRPHLVAPIRVKRGAFANNTPSADLVLSPDHAVFADGKLVAIRQLVNGATIRQETNWASVEYFHVELDAHSILLAEGLATESYLDTGNRGFFANSGAPLILHPDLTDESDCPAREAASCYPFVRDEEHTKPIWQGLADRAAMLGHAMPPLETTTVPDLSIRVKGRLVRPVHSGNGLFVFVLPQVPPEVHVVSRAALPTDTRPWLEDRRRLGVYVKRIVVRGRDEVLDIPLDHPGLSQG